MRLLAISGILRARSGNTELLRAAARLAGPNASVVLYETLGGLPHFNPDLDADSIALPPAVQTLRTAVASADGTEQIASDPALSASLRLALEAMAVAAERYRAAHPRASGLSR